MERRNGPTLGTIVIAVALTSIVATRPQEALRLLISALSSAQSALVEDAPPAAPPTPAAPADAPAAPVDPQVLVAQADAAAVEETVPEVHAFVLPQPVQLDGAYAPPRLSFVATNGQPVDVSAGVAASDATTTAVTNAATVTLRVHVADPTPDNAEFVLLDGGGAPLSFVHGAGASVRRIDATELMPADAKGQITVKLPSNVASGTLVFQGQLIPKRPPVPGADRTVKGASALGPSLTLHIDRVGPRLRSVTYLPRDDRRQATLEVELADADLKMTRTEIQGKKEGAPTSTVIVSPFRLELATADLGGSGGESVANHTVVMDPADPRRVFLVFASPLPTGEYSLTLTATDLAGNPAGSSIGPSGRVLVDPQSETFAVLAGGQTGPHVEFPLFTPPEVGDRELPFNPNDFVVTRVARLFYFRDAHRVAQIINRNVRSYNRAAVDQAERAAERAREVANELVDERRAAELAAVRASERLRDLEGELQGARDTLQGRSLTEQQVRELDDQIARNGERIEELDGQIEQAGTPDPGDEEALDALALLERTRAELARANAELTRRRADLRARVDARSAGAIQQDIDALQDQVLTQQQRMIDLQEQAEAAQAREDRQAEVAFRKEVAAANEDPDTYVPGDIDSVDPVTQVSVSVIGEGLIQLRGPIQGVNKIRTMINQIDFPRGQVKVGIFTVQINGERGARMDRVARRIEGHVDLSRFLTSHSLMLMRRSVQEVASEIAAAAYGLHDGHTQIDRDRRYLYAFFGRDFIDSLFAMDSEFLFTGNRLLSLNSMDNISLNRALFVLALARNDVRRAILERFMSHVACELPQAEYDYRIAARIDEPGKHLMKRVHEEVMNRYIFRNFRSVFESEIVGADTLNPMQLEFLRLAQIFKSQMVAEVELKQRIVERGLIQDRANDETEQFEVLDAVQDDLRRRIQDKLLSFSGLDEKLTAAVVAAEGPILVFRGSVGNAKDSLESLTDIESLRADIQSVGLIDQIIAAGRARRDAVLAPDDRAVALNAAGELAALRATTTKFGELKERLDPVIGDILASKPALTGDLRGAVEQLERIRPRLDESLEVLRDAEPAADIGDLPQRLRNAIGNVALVADDVSFILSLETDLGQAADGYDQLYGLIRNYLALVRAIGEKTPEEIGNYLESSPRATEFNEVLEKEASLFGEVIDAIVKEVPREAEEKERILAALTSVHGALVTIVGAIDQVNHAAGFKRATRAALDHRKLLDHLITEKEEKYIELVEGSRAYTANMDAYLKRLVVALEDDCRIQFYDPAFERIRGAAREYDVQLGQVERTTVLTNNRELAKVEPTATMEFDLPKRDIVITEAMKGAKALVQDYGALLQDPTFLAATQLLSGSPPTAAYDAPRPGVPGLPNAGYMTPLVKDALPPLPTSTPQQLFNLYGRPQPELGASLEALIPDPAIYKFETGTGFEIRPVIQPDGDSVIYDFNYMYTTNVREPVRPDEKHLGRVKRHFINTEVQTSTYELREISRYTVALKAARTARGVPLFEDIPGLGVLFRPLPSAESSLQQNIILGQSTVYPTLFDLMGLRWAPYVVDLDDVRLQEEEFVVRGRRKTIEDWTFDESSGRVDDFLRVEGELRREDLYRTQRRPSGYHPSGFDAPVGEGRPIDHSYQPRDPRPPEFRQPYFNPDSRRLDRRPRQDGGRPTLPVLPPDDALIEMPPGVFYGPVIDVGTPAADLPPGGVPAGLPAGAAPPPAGGAGPFSPAPMRADPAPAGSRPGPAPGPPPDRGIPGNPDGAPAVSPWPGDPDPLRNLPDAMEAQPPVSDPPDGPRSVPLREPGRVIRSSYEVPAASPRPHAGPAPEKPRRTSFLSRFWRR